ncbi:hypothetical protein [Thiomicrospira sp. ALE5]|uniref:hypothetical protein n=1 Tax=Thiomicrospira sp. ALE5 TaxID=748650 RepID=UPI0008E831FA|nr:hypothetical protein [Thiomicrospira sp. ALE5]SFR53964.1 hypothetical protein SAMN03092900_0942 [Thiomicrospira sp. ALE5]
MKLKSFRIVVVVLIPLIFGAPVNAAKFAPVASLDFTKTNIFAYAKTNIASGAYVDIYTKTGRCRDVSFKQPRPPVEVVILDSSIEDIRIRSPMYQSHMNQHEKGFLVEIVSDGNCKGKVGYLPVDAPEQYSKDYRENISNYANDLMRNNHINDLIAVKRRYEQYPIYGFFKEADIVLNQRLVEKIRQAEKCESKECFEKFYVDWNSNKKAYLHWVSSADIEGVHLSYKEFVKNEYQKVQSIKSIAGYHWFLNNYPDAEQARDALKNLHTLAYEMASKIGTIDAYNDFIISFPYADQVKNANEKAYALENKEYSSFFTSNEKLSRALLVRSKQIERKARSSRGMQRAGYMLVVNRMNELLQEKFPAEEATLRYLESEEFKDFYRDFARLLSQIDRKLADIQSNTASLSSLVKEQTLLMDNHFEKAAESRKMSEELTRQHRLWERSLLAGN